MDLHAALTSLPRSMTAAYGLQHITTPPAVPPPSSKFWDTPPPPLASLKAPTPPAPMVHPARTASPVPVAAATSSVNPTISSLSAASASTTQNDAAWNTNQTAHLVATSTPTSKYSQLLLVLEELGKDVRPSYAGSKSSAERLKRGIAHARILVREALMEVERASK